MNSKNIKVLLLEDDTAHAEAIRRALKAPRYKVMVAGTLREYHDSVAADPPDIALLDMFVPDGGAMEVLSAHQQANPFPLLIMTSHGNEQHAVAAMKTGALDYIVKSPEAFADMPGIITHTLDHWKLLQERKWGEEELRKSELRYRDLINNSKNAVAIYEATADGEDFIIKDFNHAAENIEKVKKEDIIGKSVVLVFPGVKEFGFFDVFQRVWRTGVPEHFPITQYHDQRISGWRDSYVYKLSSGEIVAIYEDVTARKQAEQALQASEEKYRVLFNNEIFAILIFDLETLRLLDVNDAYCRMYGYSREELVSGMTIHDITAEHQVSDAATRQAIDEGTIFIPLRYHRKKDGTVFPVEIVGGPYVWQGRKVMFVLAHDITDRIRSETERKQVEEQKSVSLKILELLTKTGGQSEIISKILLLIKDFSGCEAVGIRLKAEDDYPYYEANGFIPGHVELENNICTYSESGEIARDNQGNPLLECMCGNIIRGRFDPTLSFFTAGGSFWSNCTTELLASTTDEDRQAHTRNRCNGEGYESVALIPLKGEWGNIGLLQLNDTHRNRFTPDIIAYYESIASSIGIIIARKEAEEALGESEEKHRAVVEMASEAIVIIQDGIIMFANPSVVTMFGYETWEIEGMKIANFIPQANLELTLERYQKRMVGEKLPEIFETAFIHKSGEIIPVETNGSVIQYKGKPADLTIIRNITERKMAEQALDNSYKQLRAVLDSLDSLIYIADFNSYEILFINKYGRDLWGDVQGKKCWNSIQKDQKGPCSFCTNDRLMSDTGLSTGVYQWVFQNTVNGKWYECRDQAIPWIGKKLVRMEIATDITDRKRLEEERQRVDKLESVGVLAGGIAHDFNNILTSILGNISLSSAEAPPGSDLRESLEQAEKASLRAKDLTVQLLTFSKGGAPVLKLSPLTELLKDTAKFALRGSNVKCHFSIPADLWHAEIDAGQVSQIIHNLVINARQAMPAGGTIELLAENITLNETTSLGKGLPVMAGDYVRVAIADQGTGIPVENLEKIFDPFFTTKPKGSGLGLATSFSIARQHGGHISVESEAGVGSTFYLYLPASTETAAPKQDKKEVIVPEGRARILVMDDEEGVRKIAGRMLKHIGYEDVESAADGAQAIKLYKEAMESGHPFSVAILDLTIAGGMGGEVAIQKLLKIDPAVKAIVSSGYIDDSVIGKFRDYGFSGMVAKPYTIAELRKAVQDVIG